MRTVSRPPHSGRLRPKTPQGPRGHFKYQPHGYAMDTIYPPNSYGRSGYTQGVITGNSRLSASAVGTLALQSDILRQLEGNQDPSVEDLEARWRIESGITIP